MHRKYKLGKQKAKPVIKNRPPKRKGRRKRFPLPLKNRLCTRIQGRAGPRGRYSYWRSCPTRSRC